MTSASHGAILLLGATSDIGGEIVQRICAGRHVVAALRDPEDGGRGERVAQRLREAGAARVTTMHFGAADLESHRQLVQRAAEDGEVTTAVVAFGILGDQEQAEHDEGEAVRIGTVDYLAQISMLTVLADEMERGEIYAFSSIAGWRARRANYVYGSTKAGLDAFCQGLADRLHGTGLNLITARPGFVIGSMTAGMKPAPMSVTPDVVADAVVAAAARGKSATVWIPRRLAALAFVMRLVPRPIWRHMPR
ncbi:SDR family oxidoreductase [Corynebacterium aquatimens]|uniref:SDR family oxidoreductase n=1 Tax=Corynebacterium aquatimens TaxID=1190508 RepID=UPI002540857A|nr:SDR family oxidoreductase [Corynebacterium aquatimens]QYH19749.1 SDR family oxidoreductase [Corynebacterium aquatimens]